MGTLSEFTFSLPQVWEECLERRTLAITLLPVCMERLDKSARYQPSFFFFPSPCSLNFSFLLLSVLYPPASATTAEEDVLGRKAEMASCFFVFLSTVYILGGHPQTNGNKKQ